MHEKIPREIEREISSAGGVKGLRMRLPSGKVIDDLTRHFETLSDPIRLKIILLLREERLCVCVLKALISCPGSRLSYHLSILKRRGIVSCKREKSYLRYFLTEKGKKALSEVLQLR